MGKYTVHVPGASSTIDANVDIRQLGRQITKSQSTLRDHENKKRNQLAAQDYDARDAFMEDNNSDGAHS